MQRYAEAEHKCDQRIPSWNPRDGSKRLRKIEAVIWPAVLDAIRRDLQGFSIEDIIVTEVHTSGRHNLRKQFYRGAEYIVVLPKVKVELLIHAADLADVIEVFSLGCEQKVLVYDVALMLTPGRPAPFQEAGSL